MNDELANAEMPGGPRNGVMTALDDFIEAYDRPLRLLVLPFYFGLAIVAEEARIEATPALGAVLDRLSSAEGRNDLLEAVRADPDRRGGARAELDARRSRPRSTRGADRYLDVVQSALLDEHYLDNELRLEYLGSLPPGGEPDLASLRDPPRHLPVRFERLTQARVAGRSTDVNANVAYFPYTDMGHARFGQLREALLGVRADEVPGDLAECGVGRGGGAIFLRAFLEAYELPDRQVWVIDPFVASAPPPTTSRSTSRSTWPRRWPASGPACTRCGTASPASGCSTSGCASCRGGYPIRWPTRRSDRWRSCAWARVWAPRWARRWPGCTRQVSPGGWIVVEGTGDPRVEESVKALRAKLGIDAPLERVDWNAVAWRVPEPGSEPDAPAAPDDPQASTVAHRAPLAPPKSDDAVALSVVVVFYNMRREAARTLMSLSRSYQRGLEGIDYEVIALDNGSDPDQRLTEQDVTAFGPEFRFVDMGADASASPTRRVEPGDPDGAWRVDRADDRRSPRAHARRPGAGAHRAVGIRARRRGGSAVVPRARPTR